MKYRIIPIAVSVLGLVMVSASDAEAGRRGLPLLFVFNTGDAIYEVGELPEELADVEDLAGWKLGYKCSHFGLLWADVACWDKELVLFKDDTYSDIPLDVRAELEEDYPWSKTKRNPWNKYGIFLLGAGVIGGFFVRRGGSGEE